MPRSRRKRDSGEVIGRLAAALGNIVLRLFIGFFLVEVLRRRNDPHYAGKALPARDLPVIGTLTIVFPIVHATRRPWRRYPFALDNLYLSIFFLDMCGNFLDFYEKYRHFDLIPHFHGTGALTVVLERTTRMPTLTAVGLANLLHLLLEGEEIAADGLFGLRNVRGGWDVRNDLLAGLAGTAVYAVGHRLLGRHP